MNGRSGIFPQTGSGLTRRATKYRPEPTILIAPLIDIVFLLLIFFMLVTKFLSPAITVALPESGIGDTNDSLSRTITVDKNGNTYLDDRLLSLEEIILSLAESRESGEIRLVRIRADKQTPLQTIVDVMEAVRIAGIDDIAIETTASVDDDE
ncbi:MAG TPA: biopolymer transporter ExbD [Firmicutes bacterium]|nr:biopolymer transporter ExbD [Bacillota bacterium]